MIDHTPAISFTAYAASCLTVSTGANEGDAIGLLDEVVAGDVYRLSRNARTVKLRICDAEPAQMHAEQRIAENSDVGRPGDRVTLDLCHTLMAPDGSIVEILLLTLRGATGPSRFLLPLAAMRVATDYELVASEVDSAPRRFADITCASFLAGTRISLACGKLVPIEALGVGDMVLTRHNGPQPLRWIGMQTSRATGSLAPVRITAGTLNAASDLRLSPHHRLFIRQRGDTLGAGQAEMMIKAGYLVNGTTVLQEDGGHVDTFHLVFDRHEIVYAEGVAVESMLVTGQTRAALPLDMPMLRPQPAQIDIDRLEVSQAALSGRDDPATHLTRASRGFRQLR